MSRDLIDRIDIVSGFVPVAMNSQNNQGTWVNMEMYESCLIIFSAAAGGATGHNPVLLLQQAKDNAGTSAKNLDYLRVRTKVGSALDAVAQVTEYYYTGSGVYTARPYTSNPDPSPDDGSANSFAVSPSNDQMLAWIVVHSEDMDNANGFGHLALYVAEPGQAQTGEVLYIMHDARFAGYPNQSSIA